MDTSSITPDRSSLAADIAAALGGVVVNSNTAHPGSDFTVRISGRDYGGVPCTDMSPLCSLFLSFDGYRHENKLSVSGCWPQDREGRSSSIPTTCAVPKRTFSVDRGAAAIAREIERNVLPGVIETTRVMKEHIAENERHEDARRGILQRIADAALLSNPEELERRRYFGRGDRLCMVESIYTDRDTVQVKMEISVDELCEILRRNRK